MRKDHATDTDAKRLPQLTWILFLKFVDDLERTTEAEAELGGKPFRPIIPAPYRWRDWAVDRRFTGNDLLAFLNQEEVDLPSGGEGAAPTRGPGLFKRLAELTAEGAEDRRLVVAQVFQGTRNEARDGHVLRDVLDNVNEIHFTASEDVHTLSAMYEGMLREMRDASGQNGEFYTPRPLVKLIVQLVDPKLGEVVLDPACGTAGFLVETFEHLRQSATAPGQVATLQKSLLGVEVKPLPYLLAQMNLLLHGVENPQIDSENSLGKKITEITDRDRVDIILTNPPYGGEEKRGIPDNFPPDLRTSDTALLFLQLIVRKLRRPRDGRRGGRAAVVVPNGTPLTGGGVAARIREMLLAECRLDLVLRLPGGVFAPYTDIESNVLFFEYGRPTDKVWFYEHPLPAGVTKYTKTRYLTYDEFEPMLAWWQARVETSQAWAVDIGAEIKAARVVAEPLWARAEQLEKAARRDREDARALQRAGGGDDDVAKVIARAKETEASATEARQEGDAAYWPAFNLERRNPRAVVDVDQRTPEQLVDAIIEGEESILSLLREVRRALEARP